MARLVFAMNVSLDGFVDHDRFAPEPALFGHFIDDVRSIAGSIHGRTMYETMRYWDGEDAGWDEAERAYAEAWRAQPKWVASRTLGEVGPNATLIEGDLAEAVRAIKASIDGVIEVAGPSLAACLAAEGLIDEWRIYQHPAVLGSGKPYFAAPPPPLRLVGIERLGESVVRLRYEPADPSARGNA